MNSEGSGKLTLDHAIRSLRRRRPPDYTVCATVSYTNQVPGVQFPSLALGKEVVIDLGAECEWLSNSDEMTHGGPISRIIVSYLHEKSHLVM